MIQAIEETFPSEIAMKIFKFCRHPTAQMIKDVFHGHYFLLPQRLKETGQTINIMKPLNWDHEEHWNNSIENIRWRKEFEAELEVAKLYAEDTDDIPWW